MTIKRITAILLTLTLALSIAWSAQPVKAIDCAGGKDCYSTKVDKNGFYIKKGVLIRYLGNKKKLTLPKKVKAIGEAAFEITDCYKGYVKTLIIPKTCKTIKKEALIFSGIKKVVMKEGVKTLKKRCFADTYLKKVYFPKSVKKIGRSIMETEEGLQGTKIYVYKNSKAHKYFKKTKNQPYGNYKLKIR